MSAREQSDDAIVLEIDLAAPPAVVFAALTDPGQLSAWWSLDQEPVRWELDPRPGGRWRATGRDASCGAWVLSGQVIEFDPPRLLAYSWSERSEARIVEGTIVRYELSPEGKGTRLRLRHSNFAGAAAARGEYQNGWPGVCRRLRAWFTEPVGASLAAARPATVRGEKASNG